METIIVKKESKYWTLDHLEDTNIANQCYVPPYQLMSKATVRYQVTSCFQMPLNQVIFN